MPMFDLKLTGGEVIDVGGDHIGQFDVAIKDGRIAAVAGALAEPARETLNVTGKLVTPGLIDLHTHVFAGATYWGIDPEPIAWHTGVTTWADAGSAGAFSFDSFPRGYQVSVPIFLNISAVGLIAQTGESRDLANLDVELAIGTVLANRDRIVGIKVRMDRHTVGANGLEPLRRAIAAAAATGLPVMVHIGASPPTVHEMLPLLRPGDIITHCASGIADSSGAKEAYQMGVRFDIGHGAGGFAFDVLEAQLEAGMVPHTVSTDLHSRCLFGPAFDLPTTMAKMLAAGLDLRDVVAATTVRPAQVLGLQDGTGTLRVGAPADIAVFTVEEGDFELADVHGKRRRGTRRLRNEVTYRGGKPMPPLLPQPPRPWISLTAAQRQALADREQTIRRLLSEPLVGADGLTEQFPRHGG